MIIHIEQTPDGTIKVDLDLGGVVKEAESTTTVKEVRLPETTRKPKRRKSKLGAVPFETLEDHDTWVDYYKGLGLNPPRGKTLVRVAHCRTHGRDCVFTYSDKVACIETRRGYERS